MKKNKMMASAEELWLKEPETHDFPAALDYLELLFPPQLAVQYVTQLQQAPTILKKSKDILRASSLPLLPDDNRHVKENLKKFKSGKQLSPILLVRGAQQLIIADGYHRMCASYYLTEDLAVPCRIV